MRRTHLLHLVFVLLVASSFVLPRFAVRKSEGFAAAASASLVFLAILALAVCVAIYQAIYTLRHRRELSAWEFRLGLAPAIVGAASWIGLIVFLRY